MKSLITNWKRLDKVDRFLFTLSTLILVVYMAALIIIIFADHGFWFFTAVFVLFVALLAYIALYLTLLKKVWLPKLKRAVMDFNSVKEVHHYD